MRRELICEVGKWWESSLLAEKGIFVGRRDMFVGDNGEGNDVSSYGICIIFWSWISQSVSNVSPLTILWLDFKSLEIDFSYYVIR